jgi:hypothetical protein
MKRNTENAVGEPGQFKTTPVMGFTPTDHTPAKSPAAEREVHKGRRARTVTAKKSTQGGSAERELKKRVLRHRRKGLNDNN